MRRAESAAEGDPKIGQGNAESPRPREIFAELTCKGMGCGVVGDPGSAWVRRGAGAGPPGTEGAERLSRERRP